MKIKVKRKERRLIAWSGIGGGETGEGKKLRLILCQHGLPYKLPLPRGFLLPIPRPSLFRILLLFTPNCTSYETLHSQADILSTSRSINHPNKYLQCLPRKLPPALLPPLPPRRPLPAIPPIAVCFSSHIFPDPHPPPRRVKSIVVSLGSRINADSCNIDMIKDAIINVSNSLSRFGWVVELFWCFGWHCDREVSSATKTTNITRHDKQLNLLFILFNGLRD